MLPSRAHELKQQGAVEVAANRDSSRSTAEKAEQTILAETKRAGGAAYEFNPDASPEEKAAQAKARVPSDFHHEKRHRATGVVSDVEDGTKADYDLPPPSKEGAIAPLSEDAGQNGGKDRVSDDDQWARTGWAPRFGTGEQAGEEDQGTMLDHQTFLEGKLDDSFFGDWYHNTGIIIFASLTSWVTAVLGGGLGWVLIIMAICGTYYRTSIRRVRRNVRDDMTRELAKHKLETDTETLEWINSFLVKFWPIYAPVICQTVIASVDQVLSTSTPAFLDSIRMKLFTLGTKPPRMEHVKAYPKAEDDTVLMDWKFSFNPNDVEDLTARQIKTKVNPKVVLEVRIGLGVASKGLDVIVEDFAFAGIARIKVKLQIPFPHIEKVEFCFLDRPTIDYVCKPLGGDMFGFDINFIPGLETFIMEQIHANLSPIMYAPNVFPIEIAKMLAGNPIDQAIGVVQITLHGAQGLKNPDKLAGTPDPYIVVSLNGRESLGRTKTVHENANPRFGETINVIVTSLKDALSLQIFDYNEYRKDKELGAAAFDLEQLESDPNCENLHLEVMANARSRGVVQADVRFFPVLQGRKLEDGSQEPPPESNTGIARFVVEQAKDLDGTKSLVGQLSPYAVLLLNGKEIHVSQKLKRTNNPIWPDAHKEFLITNRKTAKLGLVIKDDRGITADPVIGTYQIKLDDMLELTEKGQQWFNLHVAKTGRAKMSLQWKPVALSGAIGGSGGYIKPIGVVRLHFKNARGLRNLETIGKSDPYVRVLLAGVEKGRTVTFKNTLDPDWDEVIYVPVHSTREKLAIEVMDAENLGKDRSLGSIELAAADYIREQNGEYLVNEDKKIASADLHLAGKGSSKGKLNYSCSFYPTHNVVDPEEEEAEKALTEEDTGDAGLDGTKDSTGSRARNGTMTSMKDDISRRETGSSLLTNGDSQLDGTSSRTAGDQDRSTDKQEPPKIRVTADNVQDYDSGLLIFKLINGDIAYSDCQFEVIMDDMVFPSYVSAKIRSRHFTFNETGDAIVRELQFSRITLRLVEKTDKKGEGDEDHIIAKLTGDTITTLKQCLYTPTELRLKNSEGRESKITVSMKYLPIKMRLDASERMDNSGTLRVDVLDAADLPAADRNGYSDPFCKFFLNGKEVHETKTQKKTLHPAWNERFEVSVASRTAAQFQVKVYDWDFGNKSDFLGAADINLAMLEPFQNQEVTLGLDGKSGTVRLGMLFKPDYVTRSRQGSSTFHGTFAAPGKVIGAPVKGVGKGAVFVGGNVAKGASFIGRGFKRRKSKPGEEDESEINGHDDNNAPAPPPKIAIDGQTAEAPGTPTMSHSRTRSWGAQSMSSVVGAQTNSAEPGTATMSILSATGYPPGADLRIRIKTVSSPSSSRSGGKEMHKSRTIKVSPTGEALFNADNDTVRVPCTADTQFALVVQDNHTLRADVDLGEAVFFVADAAGQNGAEIAVKAGNGEVRLRTRFVPAETGSVIAAGGSPGGGGAVAGKIRKSMLGRGRERSVTPGTTPGT